MRAIYSNIGIYSYINLCICKRICWVCVSVPVPECLRWCACVYLFIYVSTKIVASLIFTKYTNNKQAHTQIHTLLCTYAASHEGHYSNYIGQREREREWRVIYKQMRKFFKKMNMEIASVELSFYVIIFISLLYSWSGIYIHIILQHEPLPTEPNQTEPMCTVP